MNKIPGGQIHRPDSSRLDAGIGWMTGMPVFLLIWGWCWPGEGVRLRTQPQTPLRPVGQALQPAITKSVYIIVDTAEHNVILKARGLPLQILPLRHATWIGKPLMHSMTIHLKTKYPAVSPIPIASLSNSSSQGVPEQLLTSPTVQDLPYRYTLAFQENLTILVQPGHLPSFWDNVVQHLAGWGQRVAAIMSTWSSTRQYLVIALDPAEAQALYRAANPPMACLVMSGVSTTK
jgi:hypothetical protein